jgi:phage-related minor tail protein
MADEGIKRLIELGVNAGPAIAELQKLNKATQDQTESLDGLQSGLAKMVEGATSVFQALAIADLAKQFVEGVNQMIEQMDALGKAAQSTGVSVEKLQDLQFALKLGAGLDEGQATAALTRWGDKLADISNKTSDASRVMREMGITANDTVDSALNKLADAFANAPDGINKTAIATELFGRNLGEKLIPFLNGGQKGIADLHTELTKLGGTFSGDVTKQAGEFDDNLGKIAQHSKEAGVAIVSGLLPYLNDVTSALVKAIEQGTFWTSMWQRFKDNWADNETYLHRALGDDSRGKTNLELREQQARLEDYSKTMAGYAVQVAKMKDATDLPPAHIEKIKAAGAAAHQAKSDFEQWMDSMLKIKTASDDSGAKIDWLTSHLAALALAGDTSSETFKKWSAELLKLQPDPIASALDKLAKAAKEFDDAHSDSMVAALVAQMDKLEDAGPAAGNAVAKIHEQILKIKADGGDVFAAFTIEVEKNTIAAQKNAEMWEIYEDQFAKGLITLQQYSEGLAAHLPKVSNAAKQAKDDVFDLGKAISDASAKFVTDFIDNLIDGFGAVHKSFTDMVSDMLKQLAKLIIQQQVAASFKSIQAAGGLGALFNAQGGAFASPNVQYMASGGILSSPTFFAHGGRLAVAGEAGPEAVVPLQRSASGDLGVGASPVTVNITNNTPSQVSTSSKDNADGSRVIDVLITQKVKAMINDGTMDRTMRSAYGIARQPAAG